MSDDPPDRRSSFLNRLRDESRRGPGRGLGRTARLISGGAGLVRRIAGAAKRGDRALGPRELAEIEALVRNLGELKGLPMKFGQIVSYLELDLPEEMRSLLALLQTQASATPREQVQQVLREDLGERAEVLWRALDPEPVSIASIGQVYRGRLPEGDEVAVKVRHPSIDEAIRSDFGLATAGVGIAASLLPGMVATGREFMEELRTRLLEECDYRLEAERQQWFGRLFAGDPVIVVPRVHEAWCAPRVLTTSWESGRDFETFCAGASEELRNNAGRALFDFYIGTLYRHGLFHADPHPGNYCFREDGRVVVFDYGCVRVFEPEVARAFAALAQAVRDDDRRAISEALRKLGAAPSENDETYRHLRMLLRSFFGPMLQPGARRVQSHMVFEMGEVMRDKLAVARLRLPGKLVLLFRIRFGLFAVLARLGAVCDWALLEQGYGEEANRR
jgi:predicted unusual protein kinase regulating ubiquinone biosynthesis (AarF/ABC1/UbiB family)